jgi:hypothetical protein
MARKKSSAKPKVVRRLVLCLDGTWNTDDGQHVTNIVEIRDRILPEDTNGIPQRIYYDWGVGTGLGLDELIGGAFGAGMGAKIRSAYRFMSANFLQDDEGATEIYIFGFSRGAYTARAVSGFLGAAGLLRPEHCNAENEEQVWKYYRTSPKDRLPADRLVYQEKLFPHVRVRCLGIFDTVGARGIPVHWFSKLNRVKYEFHDTELGSNVDVALHALAIDEKRSAFQPSVWAKPPHAANERVEQVWFSGVHSNVGGGYEDSRLSQIALEWMMSRVRASKLGLAFDYPHLKTSPEKYAEGKIYESRSLPVFWTDRLKPAFRKLANIKPKSGRFRPVGLLPRGIVLNEYVHWTCLYRWRRFHDGAQGEHYAPPNLEVAIERVQRTYFPADVAADDGPPLLVVGADGELLRPDNESDKAQVYRLIYGDDAKS